MSRAFGHRRHGLDPRHNNFTYGVDGNLCLVQYGNGVYGSRAFDAADRLTNGSKAAMVDGTTAVSGCTQVSKGILLSLSYPRDANGQITAAALSKRTHH